VEGSNITCCVVTQVAVSKRGCLQITLTPHRVQCVTEGHYPSVLCSCVTPVYLYGLETTALTEEQQKRTQVYDNKWVRWEIVGGRRTDE